MNKNNMFKTDVKLSGIDGNVYAIFAACIKSARRNNITQEQVDIFIKEAKIGDYDHVLRTCYKYFEVS